MKKQHKFILFIIFYLAFPFMAIALEIDTHKKINEHIATNTLNGFSLNTCLKNHLGFTDGIKEEFTSDKTKKVWEWLQLGGEYEDIPYLYMPYLRSVNHFHNPITKQGFSGIWGTDILSGESSPIWAQKPEETQSPGGYYSWLDVRDYFYKALTSADKNTRNTSFAQTFRGLGQLMHLVQDLSVPAHARDDGHLLPAYEAWVKSNPNMISASTPIYFDPNALGQPNSLASVPIANLFDTNKYNGTNPEITTSNNIGLSEYTNANFVSDDTIFKDLPYPKYSSGSYEIDEIDYSSTKKRIYLRKKGDGVSVEHFATAGPFYKYLSFNPGLQKNELKLDGKCHQDYAEKLIPRAIGYSSQVLSYFFRAKMDLLPADPATDGFVIKNDTAETMEGEFHLYYDNENDSRVEIQSGDFPINAMTIGGNGSSANVNFDTPPDAKKPGEYIVVFRGKMGEETGSVAARVVLIENAEYVIVTMSMVNSTRCFVWNVGKNELAIINDNSGYPVTFPCDPANISNWVNSHKSIGKPLFEEAICGINVLPLNASCNVSGCKNTCSDEDSYDQPSNCGGTFRNIGTQLINRIGEYKSDLTTHEHYDTWKYPLAAQDMGAWWSFSNYPKQLSLKFSYLNQSAVTGAFRIERTADRYFYRDTGWGDCTNKYDGYSTNEERLSFHIPLADAVIFSNDSISNNNWNLVARTGSQAEENVIRALNARLYGEFSGKTIAQIHAFAISTGTRFADCCNDPYYGICAGPGCTGTYTCPWSPIVYTVSDLKVAAQVGYFKDGTADIDSTALPRNSSFEAIISDMYATLRNVENVPPDKLAGFGLSVQIK